MRRYRALIVDDERLARQKVRRLLTEEGDIDVVGECASGGEAVDALRRDKPDLVFLDIQMPGLSGFDVLRMVGVEKMCQVVFVTAHDDFAVQAFEVGALDYLLKPFDAARLKETLSRVRRLGHDGLPEKLAALLRQLESKESYVTRLLVKTAGRMSFVRVEEVDWIEAADNYLRLHAGRDEHLIRDTMAAIEARLDPRRFVRAHRSAIVNLDAVSEVRALFHGDYEVLLKTGATVSVGRNYRDRFITALGR
jgi:two-component system LytT family response regulator